MNVSVLFVDDEQLNLQILEIYMNNHFEVFTALTGDDGLDVLEDNPEIKVVVSDMSLPVMTGLEFIKKAKAINPDLQCYLLTGYDITEEIRNALNEQLILKSFSKPFEAEEIHSVITENLGR